MRIASTFCKQLMAARFPELSEDELSCLLQEKNSENTKKLLERPSVSFGNICKQGKSTKTL